MASLLASGELVGGNMMHFGIDLGRTGAVGILFEDGSYIDVVDLPIEIYQNTAKGKERWRLDSHLFCSISSRMMRPDKIMIEDVWANAENGSLAGFGLGRILGAIEDHLAMMVIVKPSYVAPTKWKKYLGLGKDKWQALELARTLFPEAPLKFKKNHNRAEALLIAYYSYLLTKGDLNGARHRKHSD